MISSISKTTPILLDSNVIIAYFRTNESLHEIATKFIEGRENFLVSDYVISEVMTVLQLRESREIMKKAVEVLTQNKHVSILRLTWEELAQTVNFMQESSKEISFIDCSLLILARSRGLIVGTFDQDMIATGEDIDVVDLANN